ncbi:MAG: plasmid pRiA4b ORF-3 family protein [Desulfofustis sp.]|jgi:hypothetical protein
MAKILKGDFGKSSPVKGDAVSADKAIPCYQLKLAIPFSDPLIWRTIQVPGRMTLADMHRTIQACMGWRDSDTHQFLVGKIFYQPGFGIENYQRKPEYDEASFQLHQLEEGMQFLFSYLYDGGDGWELQIAVEAILDPGAVGSSPVLVDGANGCPPEEVGDIHDYQAMLAAFDDSGADPASFSLDIGDTSGYRPYVCDQERIRRKLKTISIN